MKNTEKDSFSIIFYRWMTPVWTPMHSPYPMPIAWLIPYTSHIPAYSRFMDIAIWDGHHHKTEAAHKNWSKLVHPSSFTYGLVFICALCDVKSMVWLFLCIEYTANMNRLSTWPPVRNRRLYMGKNAHLNCYTCWMTLVWDSNIYNLQYLLSDSLNTSYTEYTRFIHMTIQNAHHHDTRGCTQKLKLEKSIPDEYECLPQYSFWTRIPPNTPCWYHVYLCETFLHRLVNMNCTSCVPLCAYTWIWLWIVTFTHRQRSLKPNQLQSPSQGNIPASLLIFFVGHLQRNPAYKQHSTSAAISDFGLELWPWPPGRGH